MKRVKYCITLALALAFFAGQNGFAQVKRLSLATNALQVQVTPDIGGRILSIALPGGENFLRVGAAVIEEPEPDVSPWADNLGYLAQETWVGPQSEWWVHQRLNPQRAQAKSTWPPDPYLVLAKNILESADASHMVFKTPPSPISGVELTKTYSLVADNPHQLQLDVQAKNFRDSPVAWDIWFNTRVAPTTKVYVPVANREAVRIKNIEGDEYGPLAPQWHSVANQDFFSFDLTAPPVDKKARRGKVFIQPKWGWLAGFRNGQVFIIQFALQPREQIHPEQGQVELYLESFARRPELGVLEMEVHAPYKQLLPDETMSAGNRWTLLPYGGPDTVEAQLEFLASLNLQ